MIAFEVPGEPIAFARTRMNSAGRRFTPTRQANYGNLVKTIAAEKMANVKLFAGPVSIQIRAEYMHPASWSQKKKDATRWKTSKPDADNIGKLVADAMNGIVYADDAQVSDCRVQKIYGLRDRIVVEVSSLDAL